VAATNHVQLLDRAVFRRFDVILPFEKPNPEQIADLMKLRLSSLGLSSEAAARLASEAEGWSFADVARACDDAVRSMALDERDEIAERDVVGALQRRTCWQERAE
jgi:AAA+ superfamily predicted ATPase